MPRMTKGSKEAKERMEKLRSLRKKKGTGIEQATPKVEEQLEEIPPTEEVIGTGTKRTNSWIKHVQTYAKEHSMTYFNALKDPKLKEGYKK